MQRPKGGWPWNEAREISNYIILVPFNLATHMHTKSLREQTNNQTLIPYLLVLTGRGSILTGKLAISSLHALLHDPASMLFKASHTAVLHLNPDPNAICHTLSPFFTLPFASQYASSYHTELEEVFPNLYSVILEGSMCQSSSSRLFCMRSSTALPPVWMQKCSKASLKFGM